jgi:hypothetical protein
MTNAAGLQVNKLKKDGAGELSSMQLRFRRAQIQISEIPKKDYLLGTIFDLVELDFYKMKD